MAARPEVDAGAGAAMLPSSRSIPSLDGVRGIAVCLVFFAHSGLENLLPGGLGVTIFFVLSGYLITTLMVGEYRLTGSINYAAFYLRRLMRLMPPLLIVTALAGALSALSLIEGGFSGKGVLSVLFYFSNYYAINHDFQGLPAGMGVTWSLAVEEHYYLFYPPLAYLLLRIGKIRLSAMVLSILCMGVLAWRCWLALHGASEAYLGMATDTRIDAILVGSLMGFSCNPWLAPDRFHNGRRQWAVAAVCCLTLLATLLYRAEFFRLTVRYTLQSLAIAPLIYLSIARSGHGAFRWLNSRPMVYLGTVSYTIYLSHQVILYFVERQWPQLGWAATTVATACIALAVAESMRRWVEQPCVKLRRRLHPAPPGNGAKGYDLPVGAL